MTDDVVLRGFGAFVDLTPSEVSALRGLRAPSTSFRPGESIRCEGDDASATYILGEGLVLSSVNVPDGGRQVVEVYRPGDMLGMLCLPFNMATTTLTALTSVKAATVPLAALGRLIASHPRLGAVMMLMAQQQSAALMDRLVWMGRLDAKTNLAALLLLFHRQGPPFADGATLHVLLNQIQLSDALGLSPVHISRSLVSLREDGLIRGRGSTFDLDVPGLEAFVGIPLRRIRRDLSWLPPAVP